MDINATLLGQAISFAIFVWFTMKYVWPVMRNAIDEREALIAAGLQNADEAKASLNQSRSDADKLLLEARQQASELIQQANQRATALVEQAKLDAQMAGQAEKAKAAEEIQRQRQSAAMELRKEVADLAVLGAERILRASVDKQAHSQLLEKLSAQL